MLDYKYRTILAVAIPLMASTFIQSIVLITDSAFLSRYNTYDFDASGNGGLLYITMFIMLVGINDGAQILMARRIGQKRLNRLSKIFGSTLLINLVLAVLLFGFIHAFIPNIISSYTVNETIAFKETEFIQIRSYALFSAMISLVINAYFMATGRTTVVLLSAVVTACSNIFLDYGLIFGNVGLPEMGLEGAALASTLSDFIGMLFLCCILFIHKQQREHKLIRNLSIEIKPIIEVFKVGSPILLQGMVALSVWTIFFAWIEQMGTYELTVSQNVRSIYFLTFVPIWGFAATTKTYVSQYLGDNRAGEIKIIQKRIQLLTVLFIFLFVHGSIFYPNQLISLINPEMEYNAESASILRMIFGSILIYSYCNVYFQTINGSGNTRITFLIEIAGTLAYLISSYILIKVLVVEIYWVWIVEYIYFGLIGLLSILYLRYSNWQKKSI